MLKGDASNRRFWRVALDAPPDGGASSATLPASAIAVDLGPDDLPAYVRALNLVSTAPAEPPFVNVQRFLKSIGAAVPEIYVADPERRMLLVEDVGETSLFQAALDGVAKPATLYRSAVDELLLIHVEGTRRLGHGCIAASIAYDERLFRWEMEDFLTTGSASVAAGTDLAALAPELDDLAARLGGLARVLSHRDYHGHNLFVQNDARSAHPGDRFSGRAARARRAGSRRAAHDARHRPRDRPRGGAPTARLLHRGSRAPRRSLSRCRRIHQQLSFVRASTRAQGYRTLQRSRAPGQAGLRGVTFRMRWRRRAEF